MNIVMSVGSFIRFGWETFKKRPWFLILATILYMTLIWVSGLIATVIAQLIAATAGAGVAGLASFFISLALGMLVGMGWIAFFIKAHDDIASAKLSDLWHPRKFWSYVGVSILFGIIVLIGFILLIVPGFIALTAFMFAPYFVIDKGLGPIEALKASARITKGNRLRVLGLIAAVALVSLLGAIAFLIGLLVAIPLAAIGNLEAYRRLSAAADASEARVPLTGGEIVLLIVGTLPVIAIAGILSLVVLVSLNSARGKASEARSEANLKMIQLNLKLYYDTYNGYPATLQQAVDVSDLQTQAMTQSVPLDEYTYTQTGGGESYQLCSEKPVFSGKNCVTSTDMDLIPQ